VRRKDGPAPVLVQVPARRSRRRVVTLYRMRGPMIPVNELSTSSRGEHWRTRADEARSLAYDMKDEISKQMMLQIADEYEHLAKRA
jgi:hypothetical protein